MPWVQSCYLAVLEVSSDSMAFSSELLSVFSYPRSKTAAFSQNLTASVSKVAKGSVFMVDDNLGLVF